MKSLKTIGLPRMMKEQGELRVFLPEFVNILTRIGLVVYIEEGYGSRSGYTFDDYHQGNDGVLMRTRQQAFEQDIVLVLRSPTLEEYHLLRPGTILFSMLHFSTRPRRVALLKELGIKAISLDSIINDGNLRLVENMKAVAWNGLEAAFNTLEKNWPGLISPDEEPIRVLILGTGMVGKHAVDAATKLGNIERNNQHIQNAGPGAIVLTVGRNLTYNPERLQKLFPDTDILVDATQRRDTALPVVPNAWIDRLPEHAILVDLAVDPYTLDTRPPVVRGIEGIPQGSLDKYVIFPDDPDWGKSIPPSIPTDCRRIVASCYSWPGIHPEACMRHYAQQLEPLMRTLVANGYDRLSLEGEYFERALYRGSLRAFLKSGQYGIRPR